MKVILIKDVARIGRKSEVKEVPDGHALNFLIPRKMAIIATPENMKRHTEGVKKLTEQKEHTQKAFEDTIAVLAQKPITYATEANEQGHLFKGINADDIVRQLEKEGVHIDKKCIVLDHPIKDIGTHTIVLSHGGVRGTCTLEVVKK